MLFCAAIIITVICSNDIAKGFMKNVAVFVSFHDHLHVLSLLSIKMRILLRLLDLPGTFSPLIFLLSSALAFGSHLDPKDLVRHLGPNLEHPSSSPGLFSFHPRLF